MTKKSIYIYILVLFINAQFAFAQSNSDSFPQIPHTPGELIVRLRPDTSRKELNALSRKLGAVSVSPVFSPMTPAGQHPRLRRNYLIRFPAEWALEPLQRRYARHPSVEAVEMNRLNRPCAGIVPNDPNYGEQWNLALMNMPQAWDIEQGNPEVTVAVVDGGVDMQHPEFRSQLWRNVGEVPGNGVDDDGKTAMLTILTAGISAMRRRYRVTAIRGCGIMNLKMKEDTAPRSPALSARQQIMELGSLASRGGAV